MIHNTTIVGLTLGTQSVFVLAQLTNLIVLRVLLTGATPRNLWMTVGGAERTALAVRCAGQMILNGCKNQSIISYRSTVMALSLGTLTFSTVAQVTLIEIVLLAYASFGQIIELVFTLIAALRYLTELCGT